MNIGMVGLGKMGGSMSLRLVQKGHRVVAFDLSDETVATYEKKGIVGAASLEQLIEQLDAPRRIWMMVPAGDAVDATIDALRPDLDEGDVLIDGGNSDYRNTIRRGRELAEHGIHLVDAGTSGGVWGLEEGYCLMVGGPDVVVDALRPVLDDLASDGSAGWDRVGPTGSGHFVKMVHNGIEYGVMQAYAEGFAVLEAKKEFDVDLHAVSELWRHGSVIRSWLLDLTTNLFDEDPDLDDIAPFVPDSGGGRWTVREAIDLNVAAPVITTSLLQRIGSRDDRSFAHRVLSGMRNQFGGHDVKRSGN